MEFSRPLVHFCLVHPQQANLQLIEMKMTNRQVDNLRNNEFYSAKLLWTP